MNEIGIGKAVLEELKRTELERLGLIHPDEARSVGDFQTRVLEKTGAIAEMLVEKNAAYGNSALDPVRVFSKASAEEQLLVRIDDKLSRLQRGSEYADEDTVTDLIGYLILLQIAREDVGT